VPAATGQDSTGSTTQRIPTPARTDESIRTKELQRLSSTTSLGSTSSTNTLGLFDDRRGEPVLGPTDPAPMFWENRSNGLRAHSLLTTKEPDLPQVESNLNKSPQEDLVVTVECMIEV
jgi:hypothetical protein